MTNQPQIFTNPLWRRQPVLNLGHFNFDIVSYFDIRISDFKLGRSTLVESPRQLSSALYKSDFLCKTKPISKRKKTTQPLLSQRLTPIFHSTGIEKTNPIKPNNQSSIINNQ